MRAGVYVFFDLVMAGLGVCQADDIAASVLTTVIGHQAEKGWILVDAGWMAMSRDRGTAKQPWTSCTAWCAMRRAGRIPTCCWPRPTRSRASSSCAPAAARLPDLPLGTKLRILPNHACATCAQHEAYEVVRGASPEVVAHWERFRGW